MVLVLVEGTYTFTVNNEYFERRFSRLVFNLNWFVPNP
jgi:hypothetical protein